MVTWKIMKNTMNNYIPTNWDNLGEMGKFVVSYKLPKLNEGIENLNRSITSKETEIVIKTSQNSKVQDQVASQVNSTIQRRFITLLLKHFEKNWRGVNPSYSTYKATL